MVQTTDLERELAALSAMRQRWRHEPDMVAMIDRAIALMVQLSESPDEVVEAKALAVSGLMREVFTKLTSIRIH